MSFLTDIRKGISKGKKCCVPYCNAPVVFCIRTYVDFDGLLNGLDAPIPTKVISFSAKEFIQVKRRFDQNWWIGRLVREDAPVGFIPSPTKLETLRHSMQTNLSQLLLSEALNVAASTGNSTGGGKSGSSSGASGSATHPSGKGGAASTSYKGCVAFKINISTTIL
ncbi:hypothetical protein ACTXT7_014650 [Hymenolepis weldensis]